MDEKTLKASLSGLTRRSLETATKEFKIGDFVISNDNIFTKYRQLGSLDLVSDALTKASLEMASGFEIYTDNENDDITPLIDWADMIDLEGHIHVVLRELLEKGTVVVYIGQWSNKIKELRLLPMEYVTLLPVGVKVGSRPSTLMTGDIDRVVINEDSVTGNVTRQILKVDKEVIVYRYDYRGNMFTDIMNRDTYGLYGRSLLANKEWRLEYYYDMLESYRKYVQRYGFGRLFYNSSVLAELLKAENYEKFVEVRNAMSAKMEELAENEDILGVGMDVTQLDTNTGLDILGMKESLERDIYALLFGSGTTSGKEAGTTYASAYIVEQNRIRILNSYRRQMRIQLEKLIRKQAEYLGLHNIEKIHIRFEQLDKARYSAKEIADLYTAMVLERDEARELLGFEKLEEFETEEEE
ncbi:MAG: hypothetical protein ACXQTR_02615 [Candidatus Methanospirareceae archaeon]